MIKTIYFVFFICAFSLGLWACTGKDSDKFKNLSSDQFEEMIQDKTIQLVDVRTVAEYSEGLYRAASISMYWTMSLAQTSRSFFKKTAP